MNKQVTISETAGWLATADNLLLLTHIRPDGDTLGSAGALTQGLRELGKNVYMLKNPEVTPRYACYVEDYWASDDFMPEHVISIDTASLSLIPKNAAAYTDKLSLCIDHHESNSMNAGRICCLPEYAACGEIIFEILSQMTAVADIKMSKKVADCLYIAVSTDTGCFSYRNTTANSHRIASCLIELGASSKQLNKQIFRTKRRARIAIEGMVNTGMEFEYGGKVAVIVITREMMDKAGALEDDIDDISNIPNSIEGVDIGITIREMTAPDDCKISVRASPPYSASEICKMFGGGGHMAAAGASIAKTADEVKRDVLAVLDKIIV